jgi:tectonic-1/3
MEASTSGRPALRFRYPALILLAALLQCAQAQLTVLPEYPLDWSSVPTIPSTRLNLTANCNCDLRQNACDLGCCCDPLCPDGLQTYFESQRRCLPQGNSQRSLQFCIPNGWVFQVRPSCYLSREQLQASANSPCTGLRM